MHYVTRCSFSLTARKEQVVVLRSNYTQPSPATFDRQVNSELFVMMKALMRIIKKMNMVVIRFIVLLTMIRYIMSNLL